MSRISQIIEALEAERADAKTRLAWIEQQIEEFRRHQPANDGATARPDTTTPPSGRTQRATRTRAGRKAANSTKRKVTARTPAVTRSPRSVRIAAKDKAAGKSSNGRGDIRSQILEYLTTHPNSTAGDVAKNLGLKPNSTSTRLSQMAKEGVVEKADRGYALK